MSKKTPFTFQGNHREVILTSPFGHSFAPLVSFVDREFRVFFQKRMPPDQLISEKDYMRVSDIFEAVNEECVAWATGVADRVRACVPKSEKKALDSVTKLKDVEQAPTPMSLDDASASIDEAAERAALKDLRKERMVRKRDFLRTLKDRGGKTHKYVLAHPNGDKMRLTLIAIDTAFRMAMFAFRQGHIMVEEMLRWQNELDEFVKRYRGIGDEIARTCNRANMRRMAAEGDL